MGNHGEGDNPNCCCRFHPKQTIVGVCVLCLRERLLVLASNSEQRPLKQSKSSARIGKVFALPSFFHLSHANNKFGVEAASASISSLEESFISIKFEENGHASWYSNRSIPSSNGFFVDCTKHRISSRSMVEHSDEVVPKWPTGLVNWHSTGRTRRRGPLIRHARTSSSAISSCYDVEVDERLMKKEHNKEEVLKKQTQRSGFSFSFL